MRGYYGPQLEIGVEGGVLGDLMSEARAMVFFSVGFFESGGKMYDMCSRTSGVEVWNEGGRDSGVVHTVVVPT